MLPFGHGLSYTSFERTALAADDSVAAGDMFSASVRIRNTGERAGTDLVQFYARDLHASVTRPVAQLLGYQRVSLAPGEEAVVSFRVPTARLAFTGLRHERIVEPGRVELWVGPSCAVKETATEISITGPVHRVTLADGRYVLSDVERTPEPELSVEAGTEAARL
ncbi:MAG: beta-glucosidase [Cryobacterium sp.]|nr:beta-glucosidase [Cryobacterium sp.]